MGVIGTVQNSTQSIVYVESSYKNRVNIGYSTVNLGTIATIDDYKVVKTGGVGLLANLEIGESVKIDDEIKRVDYVDDNDTFYVTKAFLGIHTATTPIYKDFSSNNAYTIRFDNFGNDIQISDLANGTIVYEACTVFSGLTSLYIHDTALVREERKESFIRGTYDISNNEVLNVENLFVSKVNKGASYIIDMVEFEGGLDSNNQVTVSGKQSNVYGVWLNGKLLEDSEFSFAGEVITVNSSRVRRHNYVSVLHYPFQTTSLLSGVKVTIQISNYDEVFNLNENAYDELYKICWKEPNMTSTPTYEYYTTRNYDLKRNAKIKINTDSKLTLTTAIGDDPENSQNITKHLQLYIRDLDNFRVLKHNVVLGSYDVWYGCRLLEGTPSSESLEKDSIVYTIDFLEHIRISPFNWGDYRWGTTTGLSENVYWGLLNEVRE